jgi:hypothetical protein
VTNAQTDKIARTTWIALKTIALQTTRVYHHASTASRTGVRLIRIAAEIIAMLCSSAPMTFNATSTMIANRTFALQALVMRNPARMEEKIKMRLELIAVDLANKSAEKELLAL